MKSALILALLAFGAFAHAEVYEPKPGSPERKGIMDAMRPPVSKYVGKEVKFTGKPEVSGEWAKYWGKAEAADGKPPKGDVAIEMQYDLFALLHKIDGKWKVVSWGYSSDISSYMEARAKFPEAPKELMPEIK